MQSVYGVELRHIKESIPNNIRIAEAEVYYNKEKIGYVILDSSQKHCFFTEEQEGAEKTIRKIARACYKAYPRLNTKEISQMDMEIFLEKKKNNELPTWIPSPSVILDCFFKDLFWLRELRIYFRRSKADGYDYLATAYFFRLKDENPPTNKSYGLASTSESAIADFQREMDEIYPGNIIFICRDKRELTIIALEGD